MRKSAIVFGALSLAIAAPATAVTIVDTGTPAGRNGGYTLDLTQFLAGKFSTAAATITGIQGFIGGFGSTFHIVLYSGGGSTPGAQLFSTAATFSGTEGFEGASGLHWTVAAGDYFAAFEVRPGDTLGGYMSSSGTPSPLSGYAYSRGGTYNSFDGNVGVRVEGNLGAAVPEPASWALMIAGFGLTGAALRRRRAVATAHA